MTRATPEMAPPLQASSPHRREGDWQRRMIWRAAGPIRHGGSSVESCFEPGTLRPQGQDLTTRPPRHLYITGSAVSLTVLKQVNSSKQRTLFDIFQLN
ncbi:hypothetical protein AVEN_6967-1 [Araneus ventricosus]|uniref:Uncharacterized protein n=1 Tax=Araneus ventricosus TaxID=182803 RepID=A0A4Y2T189_ARAVE|nr:hypothetical protein AVEN_183517-1 [Araneus ventricosus]GBN94392.1 hypothetical protein AVEN_6967-1 [Araneus ventricosus]